MPIFNNALAGAAGQTGGAAAPTDYQIDRSLRFNDDDSAYLSKTFASAGNRKTWTWSGWVKRANLGTNVTLFSADASSSDFFTIRFESDSIRVDCQGDGQSRVQVTTSAVYRDLSAWYHIVIALDTTQSTAADRCKIYVNSVLQDTSNTLSQNKNFAVNSTVGHEIGRRSDGNDNYFDGYLADIYFIDGQALAPTDFGEYDSDNNWNPKDFSGTYGTNGFKLNFSDNSTDKTLGYDQSVTTPDPNPDGGMDVVTYTGNGGTQTISGFGFQPDFVWIKNRGATGNHTFWDVARGVNERLMSDSNAAESTRTGGLTGFTSDGFTHGNDGTGNTNNNTYVAWGWKAGGATSANSDGSINSQTSVSTDYGFSIVTYTGNGSTGTVGHGLSSTPKWIIVKNRSAAGSWFVYHVGLSSGKGLNLNNTEAEFTPGQAGVTAASDSTFSLGSARGETNASGQNYVSYCWSEVSGFSKFGSYTGTGSAGVSVTTGFKPRWVLIKETTNANQWYVYDTQRGTTNILWANSSNSESAIGSGDGTNQNAIEVSDTGFSIPHTLSGTNRNGGTFIYAAFADRPGNNFDVNNLVATAGADGAEGFDAVTYSGTGSTQAISGLKFQPDFVWIKRRNGNNAHALFDSIRGVTKALESSNDGAEKTNDPPITSFDTNGFTVNGTYNQTNNSAGTYVAWAWKAGGTAASNTDGSITSSVSASTKYGFSVVTWTGQSSGSATVGHGLNTAPKWIIVKGLTGTVGWTVGHESIGWTKRLKLNGTDAESTSSNFWNDTAPTSSVFTSGANNVNNTFVAYCWSEVPGFSKFGSYTGNGSTKTITTGFKPAFLLIKSNNTASNWYLLDNTRGSNWLEANGSSSENGNSNISITYLDDGFTVNGSNVNNNTTPATNYIYMAFADTPDSSVIDSLIDTPTNADADSGNNIGNYCTLNPLAKGAATSLSNGNLNYVGGAANQTLGTIGMSSGKWYWEDHKISGTYGATGIALADAPLNNHPGQGNSWAYNKNGNKWHNGSQSSYGATWDSGDTIGIAFDADAGTLVFYKNGVSQGTAFTGLTNGPYFVTGADNSVTGYFNFGASGSFKYAPPTGYKSLCTQNLTDPTIADGSTAFDAKLYTGNGSTQTISGIGFSPDLVWMKMRSTGGYSHKLVDQVRGATKSLVSNNKNAELTETSGLTAFTSDGFSLGSQDPYNRNNETFVAWAWDGGTSTGSNTDGSITSSVRANSSAGFSIVSYTGTLSNTPSGAAPTVGHGLNAAPELIISISRSYNGSDSGNWYVNHSYDTSKWLRLNLTNAAQSISSSGGGTTADPTSSVFSTYYINGSGVASNNYIAYCFAPVEGYSAFGSYTGNGSADGPFVYTGFKPAFILIKGASFVSNWFIQDNERDGYNVNDGVALRPNLANAEDGTTTYNLDMLSNGFKLRTSAADANTNNATFIWAAFASNPFKTARAR